MAEIREKLTKVVLKAVVILLLCLAIRHAVY